mgnify:CR=1 FL=1
MQLVSRTIIHGDALHIPAQTGKLCVKKIVLRIDIVTMATHRMMLNYRTPHSYSFILYHLYFDSLSAVDRQDIMSIPHVMHGLHEFLSFIEIR